MTTNRLQEGYRKLFNFLRKTSVETWFDMGLFLDALKDNRKKLTVDHSFERFRKSRRKGIAFITFDLGIDGVSIEIAKYAEALEKMFPADENGKHRAKIHVIGGHFSKETECIFKSRWIKKVIPGAMGFGVWNGYNSYFHTSLQRGGAQYNKLAKRIWGQTQALCLELAKYITDHDIRLLVPVNVVSNPGNVPLAFALAIISEYMDIPVIASNHDFYWEDGARKIERERRGENAGLRDHFFTNSHVGEVFSLLEQLMPWEGPRWIHTVINSYQSENLIRNFGHNPNAVRRMPTSVDLSKYCNRNENKKSDILERLHLVLAGGEEQLFTRDIHSIPDDSSNLGVEAQPVTFGARDGIRVRLKRANLLLLQPTRVIKRKRIELDFSLLKELLRQERFKHYFESHEQLTITLLITGPIANGHNDYFNYILGSYRSFLSDIPAVFRERVFVSFPFGLENKNVLKDRGLEDLKIEEIYCVSSLTLLLSLTEGRGLPILESCASGVPIVCSRYTPEYVYSEVIGETLAAEKRFKVFEYGDKGFTDHLLASIAEVIINPQSLQEISLHNREVVRKRYSGQQLVKTWEACLYDLWINNKEEESICENVKAAFKEHKKLTKYDDNFKKLVLSHNRRYIPGITFIEFMIYLKSLIDPSFFRAEERELKSRVVLFAQSLLKRYFLEKKVDRDLKKYFFRHIDFLFSYYRGTDPLAIDHSLSYRHRNRRHYPYRKLTEPELCGVVGIIFRTIFGDDIQPVINSFKIGIFRDFKSAILELIGTTPRRLKIDFSDRLEKDLAGQIEFAFFPGHYYKTEIEIFVLDVIKKRLGIDIDDDLKREDLESCHIKPISVFVREKPLNDVSYARIIRWFTKKAPKEIQLIYKAGFINVVLAQNVANGIHLAQFGSVALKELLRIKAEGGFVIASGQNSQMLDMIDMPSYRFGRIKSELMANYFGLDMGDAYIQWVPAGLKPSLAYPTPVQTPYQFSQVLKSELYLKKVSQFGEDEVLARLRSDADRFGNPIKEVLEKMRDDSAPAADEGIESTTINGIYEDMLPWSGAMVRVKEAGQRWKFHTIFSGSQPQTVLELIERFGEEVKFAWNGGYILNNELVGKLGLSEEYIGSPLGFLCAKKEVKALPLYNKAAFLIKEDGSIVFKRINLAQGFKVIFEKGQIECPASAYNNPTCEGVIYYDLLYDEKTIETKERVIYRFAGNKLIEMICDREIPVEVVPVGLTISIPANQKIDAACGAEVTFELNGFEDIVDGIEAGPMLVMNGKECIDMETEGWKTANSIATQAARLDFTDMRGPKMGVGVTASGDLILIAINGRIRESVGATHMDLAAILIAQGAISAMGFDPGGSVTLVHNGRQLNISPYNKNYEQNIFSLAPEPRFVGNAVLGTFKE